jgi:tripartite-type tricarboxylate transporter receptor subunit TctC
MMIKLTAMLALAGALAFGTAQAQEAEYPSRTVKIIVPVPAGGGVDAVTRVIAERLRQRLGQAFIVDNQGGAAGNIGTATFAASQPDGYTLLASTPAPLAINHALYKGLKYEPETFESVALMAASPNVLVVRSDLPVKTAAELIAYVKANPGKLNYASQGHGTTSHLTAEMFQLATGAKLVHVPFRGTAPALNDILAKQVDLMFVDISAVISLHEAGNARILGVASQKRVPELPDMPTIEEAGLPNFYSSTWNAIAAPPKTPAAITRKLNAAVNDVLKMPEVAEHLRKTHQQPLGGTPEEMTAYMNAERQRWTEVIRSADVKLQ